MVFDLDDNVNFSLTGNALKKKLKGRLLSDALLVKDYCREKIVLIPVYFCFETLYLFSSLIRDCIKLSSASDSILSLYRRYYDYSLLSPEDLVGFRGYAEEILRGVELLTGQKSSHSIFYPQMFHQSYVKHVLKLLYSDFYDFDSGFKNTEAFFSSLSTELKDSLVASIITGLCDIASYNLDFMSFLAFKSVESF